MWPMWILKFILEFELFTAVDWSSPVGIDKQAHAYVFLVLK